MSLSARADVLAQPGPLESYWKLMLNRWHPKTNPDGYTNLAVAENTMLVDTLRERIHETIPLVNESYAYGDGVERLTAALVRFLNRRLKPVVPLKPAHFTITNGCSTAIEHASWAFANPGDEFLLGRPYYSSFLADLTLRMGGKLATVEFGGIDPFSMEAVALYRAKVRDAEARGARIAGLVVTNPHNPLGRCHPRDVLVELMRLCQQHGIHFISDEIYAFSIFQNRVDTGVETHPFISALSIDLEGIIDPSLVHVLWGMSKDFGVNGLRVGTLISQNNPGLHRAILALAAYSLSSSMSNYASASCLEDDDWVDAYIAKNQSLLADRYEHVVGWARDNGIDYAPGVNAAYFLWVDLGTKYREKFSVPDEELDQTILDALIANKTFLAPGTHFGSEKLGWFRIVFAEEIQYLDEGLRRTMAALASPPPKK